MSSDAALAYRLGVEHPSMPVPPIAEHCVDVVAGPIRFVVEARYLADDMVALGRADTPDEDPVLDDGGASLHVCDVEDGLEHLRFDCFERQPHYHYIKRREGVNLIVRLDEVASGDPLEWVAGRLRDRLAEMLEFAGAESLARRVRAERGDVLEVVPKIVELLADAGRAARQTIQSGKDFS